MKFMDYKLLLNHAVDPALATFLLSLSRQDTLRRAHIAFPEFFTEERPVSVQVLRSDIAIRMESLSEDVESKFRESYELLQASLDWFGIRLYQHEYRPDGVTQRDYNLLPPDFKRERDEDYGGLTAEDMWVVALTTEDSPDKHDHLVLEVQVNDDEQTPFFLWTIRMSDIALTSTFDKSDSAEMIDQGRFGR